MHACRQRTGYWRFMTPNLFAGRTTTPASAGSRTLVHRELVGQLWLVDPWRLRVLEPLLFDQPDDRVQDDQPYRSSRSFVMRRIVIAISCVAVRPRSSELT